MYFSFLVSSGNWSQSLEDRLLTSYKDCSSTLDDGQRGLLVFIRGQKIPVLRGLLAITRINLEEEDLGVWGLFALIGGQTLGGILVLLGFWCPKRTACPHGGQTLNCLRGLLALIRGQTLGVLVCGEVGDLLDELSPLLGRHPLNEMHTCSRTNMNRSAYSEYYVFSGSFRKLFTFYLASCEMNSDY